MDDKAIEELAKLGRKGLETGEKAGGWLDTVFGGGFRELGQAFEDSMAGLRIRNRQRVIEKTRVTIESSGLTGSARALDPRIALPLWDAIAEETDESIQDVWAVYIRNAVDPSKPKPDRILIDVIRRLDPSDWPVLNALFSSAPGWVDNTLLGDKTVEVDEALDRLASVGLFDFEDDRSLVVIDELFPLNMIGVRSSGGAFFETKLFAKLKLAIAAV